MTTISATTTIRSIFYERDLTRTVEIQNEVQLIYTIICIASQIVRLVSMQLEFSKGKKIHVNPEVSFKITKDFLIKLVDYSAKESQTFEGKNLTLENVNKIRAFFEKIDLSPYVFSDLHKLNNDQIERAICQISDPLQILYRQQDDWFKKINLNPRYSYISCFDYVLVKLGFYPNEFAMYLQMHAIFNRNLLFSDYIEFLKSKNFKPSPSPLIKEDDILVYYNSKQEIMHAALVAKNTQKVYAKFGNTIPFAYLHNVEETPFVYGKKYQIFRRQQE
jgi:hypothetical protein